MSEKLMGDLLAEDSRIAQAKQLLLDAVAEQSQKISAIQPPKDALATDYEQSLKEFGEMRGANLYYPYIASGIGNGPFVELADGSVKLDFISGIGVHGFGHSSPEMVAAGVDAAICDTVMQGNLQQNRHSVQLFELLLKTSTKNGAKLDHCVLSTSGAMANENSLKLVFQKKYPADRILAFKDCFAGRTLALSQLTDRPKYRDGVPKTLDVDELTFYDWRDPNGSIERTISEIQHHARRFPNQHAAIWLELIQGEGGYYPGSHEYFVAILEECRKHEIAIIFDEVQTFARTTQPFAFQHFGLDRYADVVTIGKISQVCATIFSDHYKPRPGLISQTFTGSSWAIIACKIILEKLISQGNFGENGLNEQLHEHFVKGLKAIGEKIPGSISGPYGIGGMVAFTPLDASVDKAQEMAKEFYKEGLISFIAGGNPARIRFLMPIGCVTTSHIDQALQVIEKVAKKMV